jgi:hypothetical protein
MRPVSGLDDGGRLDEIDKWFRERGVVLAFARLDPGVWLAAMMEMDMPLRNIGWASSQTRLQAAEYAVKMFDQHDLGAQLGKAPKTRPLDEIAGEFGWNIGFAEEPDGSIRWFVFDRDRVTLLKQGLAPTWDDARLAIIEELYPPSET